MKTRIVSEVELRMTMLEFDTLVHTVSEVCKWDIRKDHRAVLQELVESFNKIRLNPVGSGSVSKVQLNAAIVDLLKYADHLHNCPAKIKDSHHKCTCGLSELRTSSAVTQTKL